MFCPKCGEFLTDGTQVCANCGTSMTSQVPTYNQSTLHEEQQEMPMKWYKFLIYFALFAGALLNLVNGIRLLTGSAYGSDAYFVYSYFSGLKALDIFAGLFLISIAVFGIYTRFQLAGYKTNAPTMLLALYAGSVAYSLIYLIGIKSIVSSYDMQYIDLSGVYGGIAGGIVMIVLNAVYFNKRKHLFNK